MLALWILPLFNAARGWPEALARRQLGVRSQALALLSEPLPAGAVIVGDWHDITPLRYLQRVEGVRPDLWVIQTDVTGTAMLLQRALNESVPYFVLRVTPAGESLLPVPAPAGAHPSHESERRFTAAVRWLGYDLQPAVPSPGATLSLTFYWAVDENPPFDWTTFVHVLNPQGDKVAQVDRIPVGPYYPPTSWQSGQIIADPYRDRCYRPTYIQEPTISSSAPIAGINALSGPTARRSNRWEIWLWPAALEL